MNINQFLFPTFRFTENDIKIDKEHRHNIDFNHVHKYDHTLEEDHHHTLEDKNVPKDYYTED